MSNAARAGKTEKISISVARSDLAVLRRRARRLYGGNLSAVIAEETRRLREEEGREALVTWLGEAGSATPGEREAIRVEWRGGSRSPRKRRPKA